MDVFVNTSLSSHEANTCTKNYVPATNLYIAHYKASTVVYVACTFILHCTALQRQTAVGLTAYLKSKQLLSFAFALQCGWMERRTTLCILTDNNIMYNLKMVHTVYAIIHITVHKYTNGNVANKTAEKSYNTAR